jgi:hypothetical protein
MSEGLYSLDVAWAKWLFMENSPDKGNANIFSSCNFSHTGSGNFFHSSQYTNFHIWSWNRLGPSTIRGPWSKEPRFAQSLVKFVE